jgi:ABC-2 type transport system permease protein
MAVYKRAYRPYDGPLTPERTRFLILPRYAFQEIFESRVLTAFLLACFIPFLVQTAAIYLANSDAARAVLGVGGPSRNWENLPPPFFLLALTIQGTFAFLLTAWVAPVLVSPDLVNGALPLYLSRPFTKAEYVLGKAAVLVALLSAITWVPGLVLFALQAGLGPAEWLGANLRVAWAIVGGSLLWIALLTLLGLALSAFIRWRLVASGALVAVFFMGSAFGEMWREVIGNSWGRLANPSYLIALVWRDLFGITFVGPVAREMLDDRTARDLPLWAAWAGLVAMCAVCLWLLGRRLQAREVVS